MIYIAREYKPMARSSQGKMKTVNCTNQNPIPKIKPVMNRIGFVLSLRSNFCVPQSINSGRTRIIDINRLKYPSILYCKTEYPKMIPTSRNEKNAE